MERDFKGVWIPKDIWLDKRLDAIEKAILTEIDSLDQSDSGCYASNKYIADFCQCSESKVSKSISKLINLGYLALESFDGRTRILKSCLVNRTSLPSKINEAAKANKQSSTIKNNIDNNTLNNTGGDIQDVLNMYHEICVSLPKVKFFTDARKKAIGTKLKKYGIAKVKEVFLKAQASEFLTGQKAGFKASFDWIMKDANFVKIIEGNYDNRSAKESGNHDNFENESFTASDLEQFFRGG